METTPPCFCLKQRKQTAGLQSLQPFIMATTHDSERWGVQLVGIRNMGVFFYHRSGHSRSVHSQCLKWECQKLGGMCRGGSVNLCSCNTLPVPRSIWQPHVFISPRVHCVCLHPVQQQEKAATTTVQRPFTNLSNTCATNKMTNLHSISSGPSIR